MSTARMVDTMGEGSSDPSCSSCAKLKEALEASKKEHSLTLRMVKEKIISTDELIKKYQQKCHESDKHHQQVTDNALKLEAAQMKIEALQSQLDRSLQSSEPLRKNVARLHREKSLADSTISELRQKLQNFEKTNSELLSTAKIKEDQECAWRLEKQVQAHELQKQKKSLQKSETTIAKLQEQLKKEKEQNKEVNKLLSQAKRKTTKLEQELEKSKEEIQSVKLDAEFAKAFGEDSNKKTPKPRQQQKARQTPRVPKEHKQTSSSSPHPNQHLAHAIEELTVLSELGPALSPLPPSPDRSTLESSSSSEEESGSGSSSEDDGNASGDGDSDYSLGDLADMLIGDQSKDEKLAASPMKTRSKAQDVDGDMENSFGEATETNGDADNGKTESESSMRQAPDEDVSFANCDVANPEKDTSKCLTLIQTVDNQTQMNEEDSHNIKSEPCNTEKENDESAPTIKLPKSKKRKAEMPSPQRKGKRRVTSPKPRVMTRSRAKAMKLSTSSDADSSSERETGNKLTSTQEHTLEMSDTGLKRNSEARKVENTLANTKEAFTENSQAIELEVHVKENSQSFLSDTPSFHADDVLHHHDNISECTVASPSALEDPVGIEDNSNVFSAAVEADATYHHGNGGELEVQVANEDNSDVILAEVEADVTHHHRNDCELDNSEQVANEDDSNVSLVSEVETATNISTKLVIDSEQESSATSKSGPGIKGDAPLNMSGEENVNVNDIPSPELSNEKSESILTYNIGNEVGNTEQGQPSLDSKISSSICGNNLTSQLQTKEDISGRENKSLEENNNNVVEELEAVQEELEVACVLVVNKDSSHQTEPLVQESQAHSSCTTERKCSDLPEPSTICVGNKNENITTEEILSSSEVKNNADFSLLKVSGKETSASIGSSKGKTTEISSTVEVDVNPLAMICEKETTAEATTTTTTTTERSSTGNHKDETSQDSNLIIKRDDVLHAPDEAIQECSTGEQVVKRSQGQDFSHQEIPILTAEPSRKNSDLEGDVVSSRTGIQEGSSASDEATKNPNLERDMPFCRMEFKEGEEISTCNEARKNSDCVRDVPTSNIVIKKTEETSTSTEGKSCSDIGRDVSTRATSREGSSTSSEERNSDCKRDVLASTAISELSFSNKGKRQSGSKRDKCCAKTVIEESGRRTSPSSSLLVTEINQLEGSDTSLPLSLSPNEVEPPEDSSAVCDQQVDSPMKALFNNLEGLLDDFPALSPLPPSPCPSDDEACPASPISSSDLNTEKPHCTTKLTATKKTFDTRGTSQTKQDLTLNFTGLASKSVKKTSLGLKATSCITGSNKMDISTKNRTVNDKMGVLETTPCTKGSAAIKRSFQQSISTHQLGENLSLKRSFQRSVSESAKDKSIASPSKKVKPYLKVPQKQETSNLEKRVDNSRATVKKDTLKQPSKNSSANKRPMLVDNKKPIPVANDGPMAEANDGPILGASNCAKAADDKQSKYRPLSVRPSYVTEVKYVFKCLGRVYEDNVQLHVVVERLTTKRCISSSTPVASAIVQFLKERQDDLLPQILDQLEQFRSDDSLRNWRPVNSGFESRLLEVVSLLSSDTLFGNLISQLIALCSRSLMAGNCSSNDEEVNKGDLSLCRVLTALCRHKGDLGCARAVCYDIIRSFYGFQNAALELVVAMITVWPEVLRWSSDCLPTEQPPLVRTLKLMLLNWVNNSPSADIGNILRVLCSWGDDSVMEEELKDLGSQLIKGLHEKEMASVSIDKDGSVVLDRHSFEVVKSLELLSCVLGWQWTLNELIINNVWQILKGWAGKETSNEPTKNISEPETASIGEQSRQSTCCCHDSNVSRDKSSVTVLANEERRDGNGFTTARERKEGNNHLGNKEALEVCSNCGKLAGTRLTESQIILCVQVLGVLCRIAIENGQSSVPEITALLCGLIEETSPNSKSKVTYAIQLTSAISLLDISPWQPDRVAAVLGKWITALKESGSLQAPACVAQGLICLKSILRTNQTYNESLI